MVITRAKPEDAAELTRIAFTAKQHWGYPERWIESWREVLTIRPEFVAQHETHAAKVGGRAVGFYALIRADERLCMEHMWVLPELMGQGIGRALFAHAVERAKGLGFRSFEIESDPNAEGFYQRMGARRRGTRVTEMEGERRELPVLICDTYTKSGEHGVY
jgi:GNAT superfamily N-acetyltransferase